jgi:hypothetical protein
MKGGQSGQEPLTIPMHDAIRVGTLSSILEDVAAQMGMTREQVVQALDL